MVHRQAFMVLGKKAETLIECRRGLAYYKGVGFRLFTQKFYRDFSHGQKPNWNNMPVRLP